MNKVMSLIMSILLISVSFTIYSPPVEAAAVNTCALTKGGNFCVEGEDVVRNDCEVGYFHQGKRISEVNECKLGTCVPSVGKCLSQKTNIECVNDNQGQWFDQPKESVSLCQVGCCNVAGSLCSLEENKYCIHDLAGGDSNAFDGSITDNAMCDSVCNAEVIGCYKQGAVCTYGAQKNFFDLSGYNPDNFHSGKYCSEVLGCFTEAESYQACGDGTTNGDELDIYNYDSSGNREGIAEDCGYPDNFCYDPDGKGGDPTICRSTDCAGEVEVAEPSEFRNGESLCINVHPSHYTQQGRSKFIKPYIISCQFGEVKVDDTLGDREKVCIEKKDSEGKIHAGTIDNNWNTCNKCGQGGGILGQVGDIFGFLIPPLSSIALAITTQPCKDDNAFPVFTGDECSVRGKVFDDSGKGYKMCGYGPLDKGDVYDSDLWEPIGSCNPLYPPTEETSCNLCGKGGDGILNTCTVDECNALGDCKFVSETINWETVMLAGGVWLGTCASAEVFAIGICTASTYLCPAAEAAAATLCGGSLVSSSSVVGYLIGVGGAIGIGIGASVATQGVQGDQVQFELNDDGNVKLTDMILLQRNIIDNVEFSSDDAGGAVAGALKVGSGEFLRLIANDIKNNGGFLTSGAIKSAIEAVVEVGTTSTISSKVLTGLSILFSVVSLAMSFNPGKCVPETAYTNNERCELCGPGEGQWYCTKERCGVLGEETGHCKFIEDNDGTPNGKCISLDVTDSIPPKIDNIKAKIYDNNNNLVGQEFISSSKTLDVNLVSIANAWRSTNITINFKTDENSECTFTKQSQQIFEGEGDFGGQDNGFSKEHKMSVDFTDADKTAGILFVYLKCMDVNENKIDDDNNYVKVLFPPRPDTEPPVIKYIDPVRVMLPEDAQNVNLQLIAYDEKRVDGCKYSETKSDYTEMENSFTPLGTTDCPELVRPNNKCNLFGASFDLSEGGTQIGQGNMGGQFPGVPEEILNNLENMRTYFYNVSCMDTQNNVMDEPLLWSLSIVPGFEINVNNLEGEQIYNRIPLNITTGGNPTVCNYTIGDNEYEFGDGLVINHYKLHDDYLMPEPHSVLFECEDYAGNKATKESAFTVLVEDLIITSFKPDDELFYGNEVTLEIKTQGGLYGNGNSTCMYGTSLDQSFSEKFTVLNETTHAEELIELGDGNYDYPVKCIDKAGKEARTILKFTVDLLSFPKLRRVYTEDRLLSIEVTPKSECKYFNENFVFEEGGNPMTTSDGFKHQASLQDLFFIYCKNLNNDNVNPQPFIIYT